MTRFLIPIVLFGVLVAVFTIGLQRDPSFVPSPLIGKSAPSFSLRALQEPDQVVSDADLRGRVSLLNVWATWCVGCRQEHETLNKIADLDDVPIFGLNWKDDAQQASAWLAELGNPYVATAVDADGKVAIDWGVYGAPETFLIDANGIIIYRHISPLTMEIWQTEFVPRIKEARGNAG
jgi:cytochrome c biogenesis protein CcmG/thiol:disulfide interchange protein DsbE